jgi:hypothetical protein
MEKILKLKFKWMKGASSRLLDFDVKSIKKKLLEKKISWFVDSVIERVSLSIYMIVGGVKICYCDTNGFCRSLMA